MMNENYLNKIAWKYASFIILLITSIVISKNAFSQSSYRTAVIEPSPTSTSFAKFGAEKPSLAYGSVNIPIQLFDINASGLNIPFTMSYQTSGINVSDTPYPAGYGWVFSPNFRISRKIMGRPDDFAAFSQLNGGESYETLKKGIISDDYNLNVHSLARTDLYDSQKDIFTLSLPSGNYNFLIVWSENKYSIISIGNKIKIEPLPIVPSSPILTFGPVINSFKVTDENGVIYLFGDTNGNDGNFAEGEGYSWCTTWTLKEIILLNGEKINFTWQKMNVSAYAQSTNTPVDVVDYNNSNCVNFTFGVTDPGGVINYATTSMLNTLMLKKVEFPKGTVDITYKSTNDPFLQSVILKDNNGNIVKNIGLTFGTSTLTSDNTLLQSLIVGDEIYRFQYNSNRFGGNTTALDYWGFFNGNMSNNNLVPKVTLKLRATNTSIVDLNTNAGYADRSVSATAMQAFMLTRITYPTGGFSDYEYEPHQFAGQYAQSTGLFTTAPNPLTMGGGLRVKEIKIFPAIGATPTIKTYKYGLGEDGLANISIAPTLDTFIDEYIYQYENAPCQGLETRWLGHRMMKINAISNYNKFMVNRPPIWYSEITEYINDDIKTSSTFEYSETYGVSYEQMYWAVKSPWIFRYNNIFTSGPSPKSTMLYKKVGSSYSLLKKVENEYNQIHRSLDDQPSAVIDRKAIYSSSSGPGPDLYPDSFYGFSPNVTSVNFVALPYTISIIYNYLKKTTTTEHDGSNIILNEEHYTYSDEYLSQTTKGASMAGKETKVDLKYPIDFVDPVYVDMVSKNIVSPVIEAKTTIGTTVVKKVKTNYTKDIGITTGLILPASIETTNLPATTTTTEAAFEKYDSKGNILQRSFLNGIKTVYIWSYKNQYPVAEITNADYATVISVLGGQSIVDNFTNGSANDISVRQFLEVLRTNSLLKNALVNTYTYRPLVGISSQTDQKGMTTYYEYDSSNRLKVVKDQNNNIIKTYCYNYAGQLTDCTPTPVFFNDEISGPFTRNNCASGNAGSTVTFMIPINTYSAATKPAANALAAAALGSGGQAYANTYGTCTPVQVCKTYKLTIPVSVSTNLYVKYKPCGSTSYVIVAVNSLEGENDEEGNLVYYIEIEQTLPYFQFRYGASGTAQEIPGILIEEM